MTRLDTLIELSKRDLKRPGSAIEGQESVGN